MRMITIPIKKITFISLKPKNILNLLKIKKIKIYIKAMKMTMKNIRVNFIFNLNN